jgi:hypothetical protein
MLCLFFLFLFPAGTFWGSCFKIVSVRIAFDSRGTGWIRCMFWEGGAAPQYVRVTQTVASCAHQHFDVGANLFIVPVWFKVFRRSSVSSAQFVEGEATSWSTQYVYTQLNFKNTFCNKSVEFFSHEIQLRRSFFQIRSIGSFCARSCSMLMTSVPFGVPLRLFKDPFANVTGGQVRGIGNVVQGEGL